MEGSWSLNNEQLNLLQEAREQLARQAREHAIACGIDPDEHCPEPPPPDSLMGRIDEVLNRYGR